MNAKERKDELLKLIYSYGGACPVKIAVEKLCQACGIDEKSQNHIIRSDRAQLCIDGLIKPGVRRTSANMSVSELAEVKNGFRSPYGWWALTPAGKRYVTTKLLFT